MQQKTYYVLEVDGKYWNGWHWSTNIRSAKKYISEADFYEDLKEHSFELNGLTNGTLLEIRESIETIGRQAVSWKN